MIIYMIIIYMIIIYMIIIYLKADASAAGPKRFPNDTIQWIGSVMFFKWFCLLFVCYICSFSFAILFVETFSERSFRDLFVLCLNS